MVEFEQMKQVLYELAKKDLDSRQTLNENIPPEVGCAQAWSAIAKAAGILGIPEDGFSSVQEVDQFCTSSAVFELILEPELGATILAISDSIHHGHIGIVAKYNLEYANDWGIISNDSFTGMLKEQWSYKAWLDHYQTKFDLKIKLYRLNK